MQTNKQQSQISGVHWSFWLGVSFFVLVIIALISFSVFIAKRVNSPESSPVTQVMITGEMPYTHKDDIAQVIESVSLANFFKVNVNEVQEIIQGLPWVYSVSVRKNWPNELNIYVVDQKPIALWNGDFLINKQGWAFQADKSRLNIELPSFFGPEGSEKLALKNFHDLNKLLEYGELKIAELVLSERHAWHLTLNNGVTLNLGREDRIERVQRFIDIYPEIIKHQKIDQQLNYVDLRYDTGLAVGWKSLNDNSKKKRA